MPEDNKPPFPQSSEEIGKLFKFEPTSTPQTPAGVTAPAPGNLPTSDNAPEEAPVYEDMPLDEVENREGEQMSVHKVEVEDTDEQKTKAEKQKAEETRQKIVHILIKTILPYLAVFAIGIGLYYFYFSDTSFSNIFKQGAAQLTQAQEQRNEALETLKRSEATNYQQWIGQFFFEVTDPNIIGMDTDVSGNGLTNFQKYLLNLNPKVYDTQGNGMADGQMIIEGKNPWTGLELNDRQKQIVETYFDKEVISNRLTAAAANPNNPTFAPYVSSSSPYYAEGISVAGVQNGSDASANQPVVPAVVNPPRAQAADPEPVTNNNNANTNATRATNTAPTQRYNAPLTNQFGVDALGIDTNIPGKIDVPNQMSVPIVWTKNVQDLDKDLRRGAVHYPGTPLPGGIGTAYISGHSSGTAIDNNPYKQAFAKLGNVKDGTSFTISVTLKNGKLAKLHYVIDHRKEFKADDPAQFIQTADSRVALSTCWPINTTARRLVLYARLTHIEK
jgi:LPXTG-site transpeptidase (sortase) family protein